MTTGRPYVTYHSWHDGTKLTEIITWGLFILTLFNFNTSITYIIKYGKKFLVYSQIYTVDVCEWISNFISYVIGYVITNPCWDLT